tara:strand:- start:119 stop:403 length:285 start_codon:yes stop_codon:yes gene_type:complete
MPIIFAKFKKKSRTKKVAKKATKKVSKKALKKTASSRKKKKIKKRAVKRKSIEFSIKGLTSRFKIDQNNWIVFYYAFAYAAIFGLFALAIYYSN